MQPDRCDDEWARRVSAGIAGGSREALASLYQARFELLLRTVRRATGCGEDRALDCVQDAMLRVAQALPPLASAAALDLWLRRAALSAALDRFRNEAARSRREKGSGRREVEGGLAPAERPSEDVAVEAIRRALVELSAEERALLTLRFAGGLTLAQLGRHLGLDAKAVDSRIRRVLARLRGRVPELDSAESPTLTRSEIGGEPRERRT